MLKYHKNVEDHRFPHFQHHRKERKITMKKRCLSLLLTLCLLAALAVPAFAQEAEKQPTLQPASEHPSVLLNTPAVEVPAVRAEIEPMCVPHASCAACPSPGAMRVISITASTAAPTPVPTVIPLKSTAAPASRKPITSAAMPMAIPPQSRSCLSSRWTARSRPRSLPVLTPL